MPWEKITRRVRELNPKFKGRAFQFSVGTLFLLAAVLSMGLGFWRFTSRAEPIEILGAGQFQAMRIVEKAEPSVICRDCQGDVAYFQQQSRLIPGIWNLPRSRVFDRNEGESCVRVVGIVFDKKTPEDEHLRSLGELPHLAMLNLNGTEFDDDRSEYVRMLNELGVLVLDNTHITDTSLVNPGALEQLELLSLGGTQITDAGLIHLKELTQIRVLWLNNTQITSAGLVHLRQLRTLEILDLTNTLVGSHGLAHLKQLDKLRVLYLGGTQITDAASAYLADLG